MAAQFKVGVIIQCEKCKKFSRVENAISELGKAIHFIYMYIYFVYPSHVNKGEVHRP